jgi:hypothetical protein
MKLRLFIVLCVGLLLITSYPATQSHAQNTIPEGCGGDVLCDDLWGNSAGRFEITNISAISDIPIYANPILTLNITIRERPSAETWRLYTTFRHYLSQSNSGYCNLLIVGLADEQNNYIPYLDIQKSDPLPSQLKLFGFCQHMNLPNTNGEANRFPDSNFTVTGDFQELDDLNQRDGLACIVRRATSPDDPCKIADRRGLGSILTQFAVYILYTPVGDREKIGEDFQGKANNPLYGDHKSETRRQIYCLLEEVDGGIPTPVPTPRPIPTATETFTPLAVITNTPTPTPTPIPFQDLRAAPLPLLPEQVILTNGQVLWGSFVLLAGGMMLSVIWMSVSARRRWLWTLLILMAGLLIVYFIANPPVFLTERETANAPQTTETLDASHAGADIDATPTAP